MLVALKTLSTVVVGIIRWENLSIYEFLCGSQRKSKTIVMYVAMSVNYGVDSFSRTWYESICNLKKGIKGIRHAQELSVTSLEGEHHELKGADKLVCTSLPKGQALGLPRNWVKTPCSLGYPRYDLVDHRLQGASKMHKSHPSKYCYNLRDLNLKVPIGPWV